MSAALTREYTPRPGWKPALFLASCDKRGVSRASDVCALHALRIEPSSQPDADPRPGLVSKLLRWADLPGDVRALDCRGLSTWDSVDSASASVLVPTLTPLRGSGSDGGTICTATAGKCECESSPNSVGVLPCSSRMPADSAQPVIRVLAATGKEGATRSDECHAPSRCPSVSGLTPTVAVAPSVN